MRFWLTALLVGGAALGLVLAVENIDIASAAPCFDYSDVHWLINTPCLGWQLIESESAPAQVVCSGVFPGDQAAIDIPTPYINHRVPELAFVDVPLVIQVGWTPGTFGWSDSSPRTIEWSDNRIEGYRIELGLSPDPTTTTVTWSSASDGNLSAFSLDARMKLYSESQYAQACASSSLGKLPESLGGVKLCPASAAAGLLPGGLLTGPSGEQLDRYTWDNAGVFRGGWFGGLSQWASVTGSGSVDGHPAYRTQFMAGWALYARVQWDYHWKRFEETVQYCGWEYYGEPGWYWDWSQWPPTCIDVVETYWEKFCPPNNPEAGCPLITYGITSDWWRYIESLESRTIYVPDQGFQPYLDLVVLQSQSLLTGP